ncbi:hypothetical protein GWK47_037113 [Chionoecetes opilio]|uniref:Uncharacterized protein n=1 Tax=Chionoecetes opilio TaxID=41210 RepID=A0A8J5CMR7_CHIOP|nr:hypothetical protein GWK47_037113 [Chionoecetes opilio]
MEGHPTILGTYRPWRAGEGCQAQWVPTTWGPGKRRRTWAPKRAASGPASPCTASHFQHSRRRRTAAAHRAHQPPRAGARKRRWPRFAAPLLHPLDATGNNPGRVAHYARVRLGYCPKRGCRRIRGQICDHCESTPRPLVHYLPSPPRHRPPEARPGLRRPPAGGWGAEWA